MTKYNQPDKGSWLLQWLTHPFGAASVGAVGALLIGFCPILGNIKGLFLFGTMWSSARESPTELWAASLLASLGAGCILGLCVWAIARFATRARLPLIARILIVLFASPFSLAVAFAVPMIGVGMWDNYMASAPSDSTLIREFQENRSSFERMEQMLQTDPSLGYLRVGDNLTNLPEGDANKNMSKQQRVVEAATYKSLLQKLSIAGSVTGRSENDFQVWGNGGPDGPNDEKGYCYYTYYTTSPVNLRGRLDGMDKSSAQYSTYFSAYRHIEGRWFLYYRHLPSR